MPNSDRSTLLLLAKKKVSFLLAIPIVIISLSMVLSPFIKRQVWNHETQQAFKTGVFPECKRKIEAYFDDDSWSLLYVKAVPENLAQTGRAVKGSLDISYSLSSGDRITPEQGALTYSTGVAIGIKPSEMAEAVIDRMTSSTLYYDKRIDFVYQPKTDSCSFGKRIVDLETGKTYNDDLMTSGINQE